MTTTFLIISNLIVPSITGLFFFLYFVYFIIANPSKAPSYRYFVIFLIGFSLFLFGRPLQLILGPYPVPLIIVNIRVFILCAVIAPAIILASDVFSRQRWKRSTSVTIVICVLLGLTYAVFNTLGTHGSYRLFDLAGITARDNLTPSLVPPYYGREVTIGVQVVTGIILFIFSFIKLVKLKVAASLRDFIGNKVFLINIGIFIFACSFIVGSLAKQWWVYYVTSILSALFFGGSVLRDVKEVHHYYEKLIPFIKEDIIHNVAFSEFSKMKLVEMLHGLGKKTDLNTFIVLKVKKKKPELSYDFDKIDEVLSIIDRHLNEVLNNEHFLLLPLSDTKVGIVLRLVRGQGNEEYAVVLEMLEDLRKEIGRKEKCGIAIGIGKSYDRLEDLRISYREALNAQEYAEKLEGEGIIHVEDINEENQISNKYPVKEKEKLMSQVKLGDIEGSRRILRDFWAGFRRFIEEKPEVLKIRLYELVGSLVDSAVLGGGDERLLSELISKFINEINFIKDVDVVEKWLEKAVVEITTAVMHVYKRRSKILIMEARKFIDGNFNTSLSYRDVARAINISPSYFLNLFKQETGVTFVGYLTAVRIERAKKLLLSSELNITEIAFEIGFNNSNYFSSCFRKSVGISAKEYRNRGIDPACRRTAEIS